MPASGLLWHGWRPYSPPLGSVFVGRNQFQLRFSLRQRWPDPAAPQGQHHCWGARNVFPSILPQEHVLALPLNPKLKAI